MNNLKIVYINLDERLDRRNMMEAKLKRHFDESEFSRFSAHKGDDRPCLIKKAELGCFLSHQNVINNASDQAFTLILEDDIIFPAKFKNYLVPLLEVVSKFNPAEWDILFLTQMTNITNLAGTYNLLNLKRHLKQKGDGDDFQVIDCKNYYVSSCAAYLLNPKSKTKISEILDVQITEKYPLPIDLLWMREIEQNRILCKFIFPYITGLESLADSSIQSNHQFSSSTLLEDQLNLFYVDTDLERLIEKYTSSDELISNNKEQFLASQILFRRLLY
jgi:GR25 family glycosyltransferase involved in LPS biosynthesis